MPKGLWMTQILGCMSVGQEDRNRKQILDLATWCHSNLLHLSGTKTEDMAS